MNTSSYYKINGGKKLSGTITINGAKNNAMGLLAASLLNKASSTFYNMPMIEEVFRITEVLKSIGVKIEWLEDNVLKITPPKKFKLKEIDILASQRTRSIIMFIGSLIHHESNFTLPATGGCKLGKRTITPHLYALENMGVDIKVIETGYQVEAIHLKNHENIILYEAGDTVTENAIIAASLIPGKTIIKYASANYQIQEVCHYLKNLGVKIEGVGTSTLTINGIKSIDKEISYYISEDPIEAMMFISIAATTNSEINIKRCPIDFLELELSKLEKMGFKYQISKKYKGKNNQVHLVDIKTQKSKLVAPSEKLHALPYPGVNIDNLPFFVPIATQAKGQTLIHDWQYDNRAIYYVELNRLNAKVFLADPHRAFITGPTELTAAEVMAPPALRPSAIILVAMLAAKRTSILRGIYGIERGYENLVPRLKSLNADIERID